MIKLLAIALLVSDSFALVYRGYSSHSLPNPPDDVLFAVYGSVIALAIFLWLIWYVLNHKVASIKFFISVIFAISIGLMLPHTVAPISIATGLNGTIVFYTLALLVFFAAISFSIKNLNKQNKKEI